MSNLLCPVCNERPRDPNTRNSPSGHWCMQCQNEFDSIDWEKVYEDARETYNGECATCDGGGCGDCA